jgi:biopolymer transport protein ExbD
VNWKIRHEGSPRSIEGLTLQQVLEGLRDGLWEPTDEVIGPNDTDWAPIEAHPRLVDTVMDMEPPRRKHVEDDSRLDMNPLIDVCLVLLVFFILTTSYASLHKILDLPNMPDDKAKRPPRPSTEMLSKMIRVEAKREGDKTIITVEKTPVEEKDLESKLAEIVKSSNKTELLLDVSPEVEWGITAAIQDAAKGAQITKVNFLAHRPPATAPAPPAPPN